jgi:phosphoribosylformylglycinamidine cyclo-ligase
VLPPGVHAAIDRGAWPPPPIFRWLQRTGRVPDADMLRTFNMGIGLIVVCAPEHEPRVLEILTQAGEPSVARIGEIRSGGEGVVYWGQTPLAE